MVKYIIKRIITIILIFFGLTLVIYLLLSCVPGGNAAEREIQTLISGGTMPSDEQIQAIYAKYGLDKNVFMQYIAWLGNVFTGTWGNTYSNLSVTVIEAIGNKIGPTLILMGSGLLIAIVFGVPARYAQRAQAQRHRRYVLYGAHVFGVVYSGISHFGRVRICVFPFSWVGCHPGTALPSLTLPACSCPC